MSKDNKEQTLDEQINYAKQIVAELEQKKTTANNSLQEINTAKTTVKNTANNSLQEINTAKTTANNSLQEINTTKTTANNSLQEINTAKTTANNSLQEINTTKNTANTSLQEINTAKTTANNSLQEINTAKDTVKNTANNSLQEIATAKNTAKTTANTSSQEIKNIKTHVDNQSKEIERTGIEVKKIINDTKDNEGKIIEESTKTKIENFFKKTAEEKEIFDVRKQKTLEEIQDILAKTTSIELTRAYVEAKSKYGSTLIYENLPTHFSLKLAIKFYHWLKSSSSTIFYYLLFLAPLAVMIFVFKNYIFNNSETYIKDIDISLLILRAVIYTPLLLISGFGLSSIKMNRKLYEEYNHKHRVMQLYNSFLKELKETGTEEEQQKLREIMLETVQDKSSLIKEKRSKQSKKEKEFIELMLEKFQTNFLTENIQKLSSKEETDNQTYEKNEAGQKNSTA